jgi:plastocyanin
MRRLLLAVPLILILALAAAVAAIAGAFSTPTKSVAAASAHTVSRMVMPTASSVATRGPATVELHRGVVYVKIPNDAYQPENLVVSPGTRVVWTNEDSDPHTVTSDTRAFASPTIDTGNSYTLIARRIGTFRYHCLIHPFMRGTLVVQR